MLVILDTNVLHNDYAFRQSSLQAILREQVRGYRVAISMVTLFEHAAHYRKDRNEAAVMMRRLGGDLPAVPSVDDAAARDIVRQNAEAASITILPFPAVPHDVLVDRAVRGSKPFSSDGKEGYRDALIWETVKAAAQKEPVAFICQDGDFGKKDLSANLQAEVASLPNELKRYRQYDHFFREYVAPNLQTLTGIELALVNGTRTLSTPDDLLHRFNAELRNFRASPMALGLTRAAYSHTYVAPFERPPPLLNVSAARLDDGDVRLKLTYRARVNVAAEYWVQTGEDDYDRDYDDFPDLPVLIHVSAIANAELSSVMSLSIERIERDEGDEEPPHEHGYL